MTPGPGPRDHLRADHRHRAGPARRTRSRSRRATPTRRPTARAPGARARRRWAAPRPRWPRARSARRRRRSPRTCSRSARATSTGRSTASRSRATRARSKTMKEIAMAAHTSNLPAGHGAGAGRVRVLRPAEPDLPVRRLRLRGRHRPLHRRDQGAPLLRARRLRHAHQPDDHRRPDPRRPDRGASRSRWASRCRSTRAATTSATA